MNNNENVKVKVYAPPPPAPPPPPTFSIHVENLNREQAQSLHDLFGLIGGHEETTARGITSDIRAALESQGIYTLVTGNYGEYRYKAKGNIEFATYGSTFENYRD